MLQPNWNHWMRATVIESDESMANAWGRGTRMTLNGHNDNHPHAHTPHAIILLLLTTYYYHWADCKHIAYQHVLGFACKNVQSRVAFVLSSFVRFCRRKKIPALEWKEDKIDAFSSVGSPSSPLNPAIAIEKETLTWSMVVFIKTELWIVRTQLVGHIWKYFTPLDNLLYFGGAVEI